MLLGLVLSKLSAYTTYFLHIKFILFYGDAKVALVEANVDGAFLIFPVEAADLVNIHMYLRKLVKFIG